MRGHALQLQKVTLRWPKLSGVVGDNKSRKAPEQRLDRHSGSAQESNTLVLRGPGLVGRAVAKMLESRDSRDVLTYDQRMDVMGTFVGFDGLQVCHVAEDGVFVGYAISAEYVAAHAGAL